MSRREFVQRVALASAAVGIAFTPDVASSNDPPARGVALTGDQPAVLARLLDHLIPARGHLLPAGALGIAGFIERVMTITPHVGTQVAQVLASLPALESTATWAGAEWDAKVGDIEQRHRPAFAVLLQAAYTGYYSHPDVLADLHWQDPADQSGDAGGAWFDQALLPSVSHAGAGRG